jgi:GNAT superfamily N-acetyltransferase
MGSDRPCRSTPDLLIGFGWTVPPTEAVLLISTLPAHGQFTAKDVRPPNDLAAKMLYFTAAPQTRRGWRIRRIQVWLPKCPEDALQDHDPMLPDFASAQPSPDQTRSEVRRAAPGDADSVRELTRAAYAKWVAVIGREPRPMTADYDAAVRDHLVDLLHDDGRLVGLIEMYSEADHLLIVNVAVAPASQGRGFGRVLLAHAEEIAESLGHGETRLYTNGRFTDNLRLYGLLGYRVDREEVHPQLGVIVHMSKHLSAHGSKRTPATDCRRQ